MTKALLRIVLFLLVGTGTILLVEHLDAEHQARKQQLDISARLQQIQHNLQQQINQLVSNSEQLAKELQQDPQLIEHLEQHPIIQSLSNNPAQLTLSFTREYRVVSAFPQLGSESVLGINFFLSPEFMTSIRRALSSRGTIIDSKVVLRQTNRQGIIIRTPYFADNGKFLGLVTSAADLHSMLTQAGWDPEQTEFELLLAAKSASQASYSLLGNHENLAPESTPYIIDVPENGQWLLQAKPADQTAELVKRADYIRLGGGSLLVLITILLLRRSGVMQQPSSTKQGLALHSTILLIVIVPIVLLVMAIALLSFNATQQAAERLMQQQAGDLAKQIRARVEAFFDVPRQAAFDVELFRNGVIKADKPEQMLSIFLSQLRVQPQLTFLSMANINGEYFAASRPPAGNDRNVRLQFATLDTGREMRVHWVGQDNKPSNNYVRGNQNFDARNTAWYQQAINSEGLSWYPVYRYSTNDERNLFKGLGIGISSALFDADNSFIGVISADVALLQLSDFLKAQAGDLGHSIFIAETNGDLLATSDDSQIYHQDQEQQLRINTADSSNPLIRSAGAIMEQRQQTSGNMFFMAAGKRHLLDWQTISLPDGPSMSVAIIMPQSWISSTANPVLRNVLYLAALFLMFGVIAVMFLVTWLTKPMLRLEAWASQLGSGQWQAPLPPGSPIREVNSLTVSLGSMASQLRRHADELEQRVADRTNELALANQKLAELSLTDALTGIANRRRFDSFIQDEWKRAKRSGQSIALLIIDVDSFKAYNDHYGHQAGDQILSLVAQTLAKQVKRAGELLCRYGGEEFAIVMTQTELADALMFADRLRQSIFELEIEHLHAQLGQLSISIGVAAQVPVADSDLEEFFVQTDAALYQAKKSGRNCVCCPKRPDSVK